MNESKIQACVAYCGIPRKSTLIDPLNGTLEIDYLKQESKLQRARRKGAATIKAEVGPHPDFKMKSLPDNEEKVADGLFLSFLPV